MMRYPSVLLLSTALTACHRPTEIRGMYMTGVGQGWFFPCDDAKTIVVIPDSTLAARYQQTVTGHEPIFVRLRGVPGHEGSIYGGQRSFQVQQILELRPRAAGECPAVAQPVTPVVPST
jgi:hypothetical protein